MQTYSCALNLAFSIRLTQVLLEYVNDLEVHIRQPIKSQSGLVLGLNAYLIMMSLDRCNRSVSPQRKVFLFQVQRAFEKWMAIPQSRYSRLTTVRTFSWIKVIHSVTNYLFNDVIHNFNGYTLYRQQINRHFISEKTIMTCDRVLNCQTHSATLGIQLWN